MKKEFVTRKATHFCYRCGWIDDIESTMEKRTFTDRETGEQQVDYYHIKTDKNPECPDCKKRSVLPMTMANSVHAITYIMKALRQSTHDI